VECYSTRVQEVIEVSGTFTVDDLTRLHYFHALRRLWPLLVLAVLFLLVVVPAYVVMLITDSQSDWRQVLSNAMPFVTLVTFWIVIMTWFPHRNARRSFATQKANREPITYTFGPEDFGGKGPSVSWTMVWSVVKYVRETESLFLLYHHKNLAVMVPKHFFLSDAEMAAWRELVRSCIRPKQIEPPGLAGRWC
jgi:hypothetical protein